MCILSTGSAVTLQMQKNTKTYMCVSEEALEDLLSSPLPGTEEITTENSQRCATVLRNLHGGNEIQITTEKSF